MRRRHRRQEGHRESRHESREERKEHTRQALLDAALDLMGDERSFTSLSLREVAKRAGITPTAFYRHFDGMEDLGLALLVEAGPTLRRLLREVRRAGTSDAEIVRRSVAVYLHYVRANRRTFLFVVRERSGGSPRIREAIRREIGYFVTELAIDLAALAGDGAAVSRSIDLLADLIVQVMLGVASEILDVPEGDSERERELTERFVHQLVMIILGAAAWDRDARPGATRPASERGLESHS